MRNGSPARAERAAGGRRPSNLIRVMPAQGKVELSGARQTERGRPRRAIVVGAGVIGLAIGWRAAQRGPAHARARRGRAGRPERRGVAAGMLAPVTEADFGEEDADRAEPRGRAALARLRSRARGATGIATRLPRAGTLTVALDRDEAEALRAPARAPALARPRRASGFGARVPAPRAGPRAAHRGRDTRAARPSGLAARRWSRRWWRRSRRAGGELRRGARGARVVTARTASTAVVLEAGESLHAPSVVVAAGARVRRIEGLPDDARVPVRPVKGQILRLRAQRRGAPAGAAGDPHAGGLRGAARGRRARGGRHRRGARLGHVGHRGRSVGAAAARLRGAAGHRRARAGRRPRPACGPATPDNGPIVGRARSRACVGDRALAQRHPAGAGHGRRRSPRCSPARTARRSSRRSRRRASRAGAPRRWPDEDRRQRRAREVPDRPTVAELVRERRRRRRRRPRASAVAVDAEVVPRSAWDDASWPRASASSCSARSREDDVRASTRPRDRGPQLGARA